MVFELIVLALATAVRPEQSRRCLHPSDKVLSAPAHGCLPSRRRRLHGRLQPACHLGVPRDRHPPRKQGHHEGWGNCRWHHLRHLRRLAAHRTHRRVARPEGAQAAQPLDHALQSTSHGPNGGSGWTCDTISGVFYLVALNLIVTEQPRLQRGVLSLLLYNTVWFSLPIAALAVCIIDPAAAAKVVKIADQWARQHTRTILSSLSLAVGTVLLVHGLWLV